MAEKETTALTPEAVREELVKEIEALRREVADLKRMMTPTFVAGYGPPTKEERLAGLQRLREFREEMLRRRGGVPLPPSAEEIARMREERTAQILGEGMA
ncbi:MAG: hypothetical protein GX774_18150 [Armatimonadetes bacterium]|jgi:hypothetical protein|nr:hypothetical protein [Armatimonadota bacterium]